jgi:hypothetical protein
MKVTIEEAIKLKMRNEYHEKDILKKYEIYKGIIKFHPCISEVYLEEYEDGYWLDSVKFFLKNEKINVIINYWEHKKRYTFTGDWAKWNELKNITSYRKNDIYEKFEKPRNVGVLNKKKIQDWIKYEEDVYLACKAENDSKSNKIKEFLNTLKGENVTWFKNDDEKEQYQGEIIKNGVVYSFSVNDGHINENIKLHYSIDSNLKTFKLLSDNKINRENKLKRILDV